MSDSKPETNLTEAGAARSASPPSPVEPQPQDPTPKIEDEERRGWPDEPTTS